MKSPSGVTDLAGSGVVGGEGRGVRGGLGFTRGKVERGGPGCIWNKK